MSWVGELPKPQSTTSCDRCGGTGWTAIVRDGIECAAGRIQCGCVIANRDRAGSRQNTPDSGISL